MSILIDSETRLCVAGLTGREGRFHWSSLRKGLRQFFMRVKGNQPYRYSLLNRQLRYQKPHFGKFSNLARFTQV